MSDPGLTSEQRAAIAVHNATQNRMCLNLSGNGQICVACSEVADQIDAAVEVERQRSREALAAARRECEGLRTDLAVSRQANEVARELRKALSDRLDRVSDALTDCGYTSKQARVAAISVLEEDIPVLAAPADGEEGTHD